MQNTCTHFAANFVYVSFQLVYQSSGVYAIRIPEFRQALPNVCCFRRRALMDSEGNMERFNMVTADHNHSQLTFEQKIVHGGQDTKL